MPGCLGAGTGGCRAPWARRFRLQPVTDDKIDRQDNHFGRAGPTGGTVDCHDTTLSDTLIECPRDAATRETRHLGRSESGSRQPEQLGARLRQESAGRRCGDDHSRGRQTRPRGAPFGHRRRPLRPTRRGTRPRLLALQAGANGIVRANDSEPAHVVALFDLANTMVALAGKGEPTIPQSLHDITVIGKGTAEDRAWVFAELLRQGGIDAVILRPHSPASEAPAAAGAPIAATSAKGADPVKSAAAATAANASEPATRWLVGALVGKQVYLFDPTLGWPIPTREDKGQSPKIESAATLAEVLADDGLLRKLDVSADKPYPLHSADLKSCRVEIITSSCYWSPRMRRLEMFLSGDRSATIYAPLGDVGSRPGLISRVIAAGGGLCWKKENVAIWDYPDRQMAAVNHLDQQATDIRDFRWLPFSGPVTVEFEKESPTLKVNSGNRKQIKSRISQLEGDCAGAIRNYLLVQLDELPQLMPLPPEMQAAMRQKQDPAHQQEGTMAVPVPKLAFAMNYRAAEDAKFWMGVCQFQQNMLEPAVETLDAYWRRYLDGGKWIPQAGLLRGLALAKSGKYALAVQQMNELLRAIPENESRRATYELFATRWRPPETRPAGPQRNRPLRSRPRPRPNKSRQRPMRPLALPRRQSRQRPSRPPIRRRVRQRPRSPRRSRHQLPQPAKTKRHNGFAKSTLNRQCGREYASFRRNSGCFSR